MDKKICILILACALFLCSCKPLIFKGENGASHKTDSINKETTDTRDEIQKESENNIIFRPSTKVDFTAVYDASFLEKIINSKVELSLDEIEKLKNTINSIQVEYLYEEYFEIDKAMSAYEQNRLNAVSNDLNIINPKLKTETLYNIVKKNNEKFLEENWAIKKYTMPSDSELKKICKWVCESINYEIDNGYTDINAIEERVNGLKIFSVLDYAYGYYSFEHGLLAYNKSMIEASDRSTLFEEIICHETKHLVQVPSKKEVENTSIIDSAGVCYKYDGLKVNSLYPNWLFEGVAELLTIKQLNIEKSLNYLEYINSLELLIMSTITKHEVGILENICMEKDLEELYKYFGAVTPEEKKEISTMLYAYNIILIDSATSSTNDFHELYKSQVGEKMDFTERRFYSYNLSSSISQTLSKIFYSNLLDSMENKEISLSELFSLITSFEDKLSEQNRYFDSIRSEELEAFFMNYSLLQEEFFSVVAEKLNCSMEEVRAAYQFFYIDNNIIEKNSIISPVNNDFVNKVVNKYRYYRQGIVVEMVG